MTDPILCKNATDAVPGCLGIPDARYTLDFSDVEPGAKIYWCAKCGPEAHAMERAITAAVKEHPGFLKALEAAVKAEEGKTKMGRHTTEKDPKRCATCKHFDEEGFDCKRYPRRPGEPPVIPTWTCVGWENPLCKRCEEFHNNLIAVHCMGWRKTDERCEECGANLWEEIL